MLAWLVAGARAWYAAGKVMPEAPPSVAADTEAWRSEHDVLFAYASERLVFEPLSSVLAVDLVADLNYWLQARGSHPWSERLLASRLTEHQSFPASESPVGGLAVGCLVRRAVWGRDGYGMSRSAPVLPTGPVEPK